jgi:hypothetical protein
MSALDMDRGVAMVALHARSVVSFADLAHLGVFCPWNQGDGLARTEGLGVSKLDLGREHGTGDVHPVVVGRPLQGFARVDGAVHLLLLLAVVISRALGVLAFHPLPLPVLLSLFLMRIGDLGVLHKVVCRILDRAKDTLVVLVSSQYP